MTHRPLALCTVALLFILITLAASPSAALATTIGTTPPLATTTVNDGPGDQFDPHISGSLVSYTSAVSGYSEIRYYDLATGSDTPIPTNGAADFLSDVAGGTVVYTHQTIAKSAIVAYDTATAGPAQELDPQPASNRHSAVVGNRTVAWVDNGFFSSPAYPEIVAYDLAAGTPERLTNDLLYDTDPAVAPDGSLIVWTKCQTIGVGCDIWQARASGAGWTPSQLTGAQGEENNPDTNGQVVVYDSVRGGEGDIFWQPVGGGIEQRVALSGFQRNPNISGNLIAFERLELAAATPNWDIFLYDLATDIAYRPSGSLQDETLNDISVAPDGLVRVVYTAQDPADANVYALSFRLPQRAAVPTSKDQCKDGGWQSFGVFKNQGDCVSYVTTHGKNPPS
jgi:Tol biopolymer transport system component